MAEYEGMRWFKCDLQMQTPADAKHWRGKQMGTTPEERELAADAYVRRCYEAGLEVVAVTDHNFLSKDFIPLLEASIHKMTGEFGYRLVVLPGFEIEADVGKGVHVLAIFEPGTKPDELDHILTECGVGYPRLKDGVLVKSTQRLPELLTCVQRSNAAGKQQGLVVLPHLLKNDGLFDNDKVSEWLQQDEFLNPELLAVEVPKPVRDMNASWQKLFGSGPDCEDTWRRQRPIACLMSSDAKALTKEECAENYIGMRFSWIRMSSPSIEALRQAFLDHGSRIRLQANRPSDDERHPRLVSLSVSGASFLEDQTVHFSPNLNCVIGGRGSGKSSLLEYLRFCLQPDYLARLDADLHEKVRSIRRTVEDDGAELRLVFEVGPGIRDTVLLRPSKGEHRISTREVHDLQTVLEQLHVQFFSQGELSRLSKPGQRSQVLRLIDASCGDRLTELSRGEAAVRGDLEQLFAASHQAEAVGAEVQRAKQELEELTRQWQARKEIQADAQVHRLAQDASRFAAGSARLASSDTQSLRALVKDLQPLPQMPEGAEQWPSSEWFVALHAKLSGARTALSADVEAAVERYEQAVRAAIEGDPAWASVSAGLESAEATFLGACEAKGVQPSDVSKLQEVDRQRSSKQAELDVKQGQLQTLIQRAAGLEVALAKLHGLWREQFNERKKACDAIQNATTLVAAGFMLDARSFEEAWERVAPRDNRTRLGRNWYEVGKSLFGAFAKSTTLASPWEALTDWLADTATVPEESPARALMPELVKHFESPDVRAVWEKVRLTRVDDRIDVELKRTDGTSAGWMSGEGGKTLSEGQRNTALLSLILAEGTGPIVIDQPEDELDSNYIFSDLVPLLRNAKNGRQVIMATHNANLPVNADAELIYAFDAREGKGTMRTEGGLDRPSVTRAVLDIMEGSERAFKQRSEKYHF